MQTQIFGSENEPKPPISKIVGATIPLFLTSIEARGEEIEKEALRLQKEKEVKETSYKIFKWVKETPDSQIAIITDWANQNLASSAIRFDIIKAKKSQNLVIKISEIIGSSNYKLGQTWYIRNMPEQLKKKVKRGIEEKLATFIKNENARSALLEMRLAQ